MNHRVACVMVACLALVPDSLGVLSATVYEPTPNIEILVGGTPQRRYAHNGRWYVEALKGREYSIQLRNPFGVRVAIALSVDGLNTIDARQTSANDARKWVLDPYQTITVSGWQTSRTEARRFEFTTEERSYGQALGKTANFGVISAVFFRERVAVVSRETGDYSRARRQASEPQSAAPAPAQEAPSAAAKTESKRAADEYAATGMGRRTNHAVTQVYLDLEAVPAQLVSIRYEFRPQLVKLGILPPARTDDPLDRRERARGFEPGFAPVPPSLR
jgi:hypothetical protein